MCQGSDLESITDRKKIFIQYLLVLTGALALYGLTCAPAILWQDSAGAVYRIWHNDIEGNGGLAVAHPLYFIIGIGIKYLPFGDLAYKINLMSAVFGAITIANLFLLLRLWLGRVLPAIIGSVTLAVSWTFWQNAVIAEVYTVYMALLTCELILLLLYIKTKKVAYLYFLGLINGLAIAEHMWAIFGFTCYTVFLIVLLARKQINLKHLGIIVLLWVVGASPYEYLIIKNIVLSGDIGAILASAAFGEMWKGQVLNTSISMRMVMENIIFLTLNFPTPVFLLFFVGLYCLYRSAPSRSFAIIILVLLVLFYAFAFRYSVADRHVFFLPFYCLAAVLIGLGADIFITRYNRKVLVFLVLLFTLLPVAVYCVTPTAAKKMYKSFGQRRQLPYRDDYKYFLQPWKTGYRGAERYAEEAFSIAKPNAIIYVDHTVVHPLLYMQEVKGKRSDFKIVSKFDSSNNAPIFNEETITKLIENFTIYVVSPLKGYCPAYLLDNYDFIQEGILWRVKERD